MCVCLVCGIITEAEQQLEEVRHDAAAQEEVTRHLWHSIHHRHRHNAAQENRSGARKEGEHTRLERELRAATEENVMLREVWQALILESGLNWAVDDDLRATMFSLQQPPPALAPQPATE